MSISHNLETLSEKQKSDILLAQQLLNNLNSLKPSHVNNTTLKYNGERFNVIQTGFAHKFLTDDIHLALKQDLVEHKEFILKTVRKEFQDYDIMPKSDERSKSLRVLLDTIMDYYKDYPIYLDNTEFGHFIIKLDDSIQKELPKP